MTAGDFGLAFLGCGKVTGTHSRVLRKEPGVARFYASRDRAKAEAFARKLGGAGAFGSYDEALADPRVHAVVVATPPSSHLDLTLRALEAGKHVVVEKPPFMRAADFETVRRAKEAAGRRVMVAENYYYKPLLESLRETLASGAIGEVRLVTINALKHQRVKDWRGDPAVSGPGALFEGGIHWIDFMANLGLPVASVHGYRPGSGEGPDRTMVAVFRYAGGAVGTLFYSWEIGSPMKGLRLSAVYGSQGAVTFETNGVFLAVRGRKRRLALPRLLDISGYGGMWKDFVPALREGREPRFDFDKARRDLELVEAVYRSAASVSDAGDAALSP